MTYAYFDYIFISDKWDRLLILLSNEWVRVREKYKFLIASKTANFILKRKTRNWCWFCCCCYWCFSVAPFSHPSREYTKNQKFTIRKKSNVKSLFIYDLFSSVYIKIESSIQRRFSRNTNWLVFYDFSSSTSRCCTIWR